MKLSNQSMGAIMMALQKSLLEQTDIVPVLQSFIFKLDGEELIVSNPPSFKIGDEVFNPDVMPMEKTNTVGSD
tara:strand:+ start:166 stop:384 length:219 start_codon:yes stop_codon:yes gene_type:complete